MVRRSLLIAVLAVLPLPAAAQTPNPDDCTPLGRNVFVRDQMQDIYLWYREMPAIDPAAYASPDATLEALRYRTFDEYFSFVTDRASNDAYYSDSQFIGFGFSMQLEGPDDLRIAQVFPDSPASEAGLLRGDHILEMNGRAVADVLASGELGSILGPSQIGVTGTLVVRGVDGRQRTAPMTKRPVTIPTVSLTTTFDVGGKKVGYIVFRNFVQPSNAALSSAFAQLRSEGATELVLDLRYNGGGLVSVAQYLGGLIGGRGTEGQLFVQFVHNDKKSYYDSTLNLPSPPAALGLSRLVVITTQASASASELIINGLRPYIPVVVVGDRTYGKPVGQYGFNFCDKVLYPVAFSGKNARGEGDYFDGIPVDCPAADDLEHQFGDPGEASLSEALAFIQRGRCSATAAARARVTALRRPPREMQPHHEDGWQELVGAY